MPESKLDQLKQATQTIVNSQNTEEKLLSLSKAFELFSDETVRLEKAYSSLKEQYEIVNAKLQESNQKLSYKVFEFHVMMNYLTSILHHMSQGILFLGCDGIVTTYNHAAEKILGVKREEVLFHEFWKTFPDRLLGFSMQEAVQAKQVPERTFVTLQRSAGDSLELEIDGTYVAGNPKDMRSGSLQAEHPQDSLALETDFNQGVIILIRDMTEVRRLQMIANRNDRMKELGEMAAMMAHEIRNPLGGIKGFASLLVRDLKDQPELQEMARYIVEGTDNLNRLVTDVLNYSRPIQMKLEKIDILPLLEEIRRHVNMDHKLIQGIEFFFTTPLKELELFIDGHLFKSVMLNLIVNAIQAMPKGGILRVELEKSGAYAIVKVVDQGEGIPLENREKIFSPFFTTKPQGHGFGLAEVYRIIQGHCGSIEVASEMGKGSTFTIKLPLNLKD